MQLYSRVYSVLLLVMMVVIAMGAEMYDPEFDYLVVFRVKGPLGISFRPHSPHGVGTID